MNQNLSHLPQQKQADLDTITQTIRDHCDDLEMIILYGSYARGGYKEAKDLKPDRKSGHVSDYDILVVPKAKKTALNLGLWHTTMEQCNQQGITAPVRIIAHDIINLNIKLAYGQYFYTDVKKEGIVLYDSGNCELAEKRELNSEEKQRIAQDYFDHGFKNAEVSYKHYGYAIKDGDLNEAAFDLHQATEAAYKTVLLVFKNESPHEHYLWMLKDEVDQLAPTLTSIFKWKDDNDEKGKLFRLLDYAYLGARYDPNFSITREELEFLGEDIERLVDGVEKVCLKKIKSLHPR